ncbi:hypothetical protein [Paucibacter soli]|uniref:hypothetical protein n=1 Tax=Paucibacter soli TaxID=3133433 RepID=UPI0030B12290
MRNPYHFEVGAKAYVSEQSLDRLRRVVRKHPSESMAKFVEQLQRYLGHIGKVVGVKSSTTVTVEFSVGVNGVTQRFTMDETCVDPIRDLPAPHTERSSDGRGRTSYDPTFDFSKPWSVVVDGTVLIHKQTREDAQEMLREKGCKW